MRRAIRCYRVFTPTVYRFLVLVALPVLLVVCQIRLRDLGIAAWMGLFLWMPAEIIADFWAFSGIASGDGMRVAYLQASSHGTDFLGRAVGVNMARQLAEILLYEALGIALQGGRMEGYELTATFLLLLICYVAVAAVSTAVRFGESIYVNVAAASLIDLPTFFLWLSSDGIGNGNGGWEIAAGLAMAVLISVVGMYVVMYRFRRGYYDKAD